MGKVIKADFEHVVTRACKRKFSQPDQCERVSSFLLKCDIKSVQEGNFTTVIISDSAGIIAIGNSKRNPMDRDNPTIGHNIALQRAVEKVVKNFTTAAAPLALNDAFELFDRRSDTAGWVGCSVL